MNEPSSDADGANALIGTVLTCVKSDPLNAHADKLYGVAHVVAYTLSLFTLVAKY